LKNRTKTPLRIDLQGAERTAEILRKMI